MIKILSKAVSVMRLAVAVCFLPVVMVCEMLHIVTGLLVKMVVAIFEITPNDEGLDWLCDVVN